MDLASAEDVSGEEFGAGTVAAGLIDSLRQAIGADAVLTDYDERRFFSEDVFRSGLLPIAVVQPSSVEMVQHCVALCNEAGAAIVPRGGGMSYTDGYLPVRPLSVTFDLSHLNRILHISAEDMYVTVEAGCAWDALNNALAPLGLRTPYWGPVSGGKATVGGALSQNSVFWGAVRHGAAAENVLGLDVVLADGSLLGVGAHGAKEGSAPFFRTYGPELTGLFTGDCGAMGLKVRATFPLIKRLPYKGAISFGFNSPFPLLDALSEMGREQVIAEAAMFDRGQQDARVTQARLPFSTMLKSFIDVAKADGIGAALGMAAAGQKFLAEVDYSLHLILEAPTQAELKRHLDIIKRLASTNGGWQIAPTIARVLSARPFPPPSMSLIGSRFLPVHGIIPHSKAKDVYRNVMDIFARRRSETDRLKIKTGVFTVAVGAGAILIEPTCHWPGAFLDSHPRLFDVNAGTLPQEPPNPEAQALVTEIRNEICEMFLAAGAGHLQIGKQYPFERSRSPETWALLTRIKSMLDQRRLMNPTVLGFD